MKIWIPESFPGVLEAAMHERGLNQRQLANRAGVRACRISEFVAGRALPDQDDLEALCRALSLRKDSVIRRTGWTAPARGRPDASGDRELLDAFARADRYIPPRDRDFAVRLRKAEERYGAVLDVLAPALLAREDWGAVTQVLREAPADSADEAVTWMHALHAGFTAHWMSPLQLGFEALAVLDARTWRPVGHLRRPVLGLTGPTPMVLIPQVGVRPSGVPFVLDFVAGVKDGGRITWKVVEVDGAGHDSERDDERRRLVRLPEIRVVPEDLKLEHFGSLLVGALLDQHRAEAIVRPALFRCGCGRTRRTETPHPMSLVHRQAR